MQMKRRAHPIEAHGLQWELCWAESKGPKKSGSTVAAQSSLKPCSLRCNPNSFPLRYEGTFHIYTSPHTHPIFSITENLDKKTTLYLYCWKPPILSTSLTRWEVICKALPLRHVAHGVNLGLQYQRKESMIVSRLVEGFSTRRKLMTTNLKVQLCSTDPPSQS